jgi:hypothetical protein
MSNEELKKYEMIKQSSYKIDENMNEIQLNFFTNYVKSKNWDISNLTNEQIKEIKSKKEFKNPGMILG